MPMCAHHHALAGAFDGPTLDLAHLRMTLEGLDETSLVEAMRSIGKPEMQQLWVACEGEGTTAEDFVPRDAPVGTEIIHVGKNSLPVFNQFEKRFAHAADRPGACYGYNESPTRWAIGPGYFVAHHDDNYGEFGVNYFVVPPAGSQLPNRWPRIVPNEQGLQQFVYGKTIDYMRRVAEGVTIGRAVHKGKATDNYFVLVRTGS
ncbi:MAG: hypothetical protein ACI9MR_004186 [Myxococcota bacterium]|jgi:hypothetical protein